MKRDLYLSIWRQLSAEKHMILLSGPRQSGKTTLGKMIADDYTSSLYFNWDAPPNKAKLIENPYFFQEIPRKDDSIPIVMFDEIHKYRHWKNYLKGSYDTFHEEFLFLVMGSGRMDIYQRGGDSLAGRYLHFHLWPLTLAELADRSTSFKKFIRDPLGVETKGSDELEALWHRLGKFSGFPEPYLAAKATTFRRWSNAYSRTLIREDIRDLTEMRSADDIEILYSLLPSKAGSPLSISSLSRDLQVAYNTVKSWISVLQRFYMLFSIPTWTPKIVRAIRKETKVYLFNYALIDDPASRFENMIAMELLRAVSSWNDIGYGDFTLHFLRDKEKREVDFLIADGRKPMLLVETKLSDTQASADLVRFQKHLKIPAVQLVNNGDEFRLLKKDGQKLLIAPAWQWLARLP
ncbi:MAG: ATP-binding protein [Candidatus Krumholzibacteriota bacterium]|nr:ATP-binding protein [Candidatus Krumholzibacteriota bacterium]